MDDLSGRVLGDFELLERLGDGGSSTVYRARQRQLGRHAVVKILHARLQSRDLAVARFEREARLAARFDHPYAAHVYASGVEHDGLLWIAMELVQGETLHERNRARGPMPFEQLVPFYDRVTKVVAAAHAAGIVHRDLKPSNIMVLDDGGALTPKLLDFGIAKIIDDASQPGTALAVDPATGDPRLTDVFTALGSPPYMAPEQWDDPVGVRAPSDLYALGVVAYETLTGRQPFVARSLTDYAEMHRSAPVPPVGAELGEGLDRFFARALAKRPKDRYRGARELFDALQALRRPHECVNAMSQQWEDRGRPSSMLLPAPEIRHLDACSPSVALSETVRPFVTASRRGAVRKAWAVRAGGVLAMTAVFGVFAYRSALDARTAERIAAATVTLAALEQGRQALLHGETGEARLHLGEAWRRGERSRATTFMLARAQQPRLAEQARFASTKGRMWSGAFSPDGRQIVTTDDASAQIWDAGSHRRRFVLPHGDVVYEAAYTPDGAQLVTASAAVRLWEASTGALLRVFAAPARRYFKLAVHGDLVAAIDVPGEMTHVWSATTGALLAELRSDGSAYPSLAFSADGRWLAASGGDDVRVFDTSSWTRSAPIPARRVRALAFDPTGPRLVTGSADGDASIWAIPSCARVARLRAAGEAVDAVAYAPSGELVAVAARDGGVQVWSTATGAFVSRAPWRHGSVRALEFDPRSQALLAAGADGTVAVMDPRAGLSVAELEGPTAAVMAAHFSPDGQRIVGASWDGTARVWDASPSYRRWSSPALADECGFGVGADVDRRFVAVGCSGHPTRVWDTDQGVLVAELPAVTGDVAPVVSADGTRAAFARGSAVVVYELQRGTELRQIEHAAPVTSVTFAPSTRDVVSGAANGSLMIGREGSAPISMPSAGAGIDAALALADGRVVAADMDGRLRIYDVERRAQLADIDAGGRAFALRASPDGRRLVTIQDRLSSRAPVVYDLVGFRPLGSLSGHGARVFSARWVSEGRILTAGGDGTARLWDGATARGLQVFTGGGRFLADATLSPDGTVAVAAGGEGRLRFWDVASGRALWSLPAHKSYVIGLRYEGESLVSRGFGGDLARWVIPDSADVAPGGRN